MLLAGCPWELKAIGSRLKDRELWSEIRFGPGGLGKHCCTHSSQITLVFPLDYSFLHNLPVLRKASWALFFFPPRSACVSEGYKVRSHTGVTLDESDRRMRGGFEGVGCPGQRWMGDSELAGGKTSGRGSGPGIWSCGQMELKEAQESLPSACPSSRFPARRLTRSHGLPGSRGLTPRPQFLGRARETAGPRARCECAAGERAAPSLLRLTDLGRGPKGPWGMGVGALSACGVTRLGPQTADPDAGPSSRSAGAATTCWSGGPGWRLCRLRRPCRGASDVGVTSPPPSPGRPRHTSQAFAHRGGRLFLWRAFPGRAGWRRRLRAPPSRDSLSCICCRVGITMVIPGLSRAPDTREA